MSETANIARMAEIVSREVFGKIGWQRTGPANYPWPCRKQEHHTKGGHGKHPTDVVFYYDSPYEGRRVYVNTDLKSYGRASIQPSAVAAAVKSLAQAVECANISPDWQNAYQAKGVSGIVCGLLFVYNHDAEYTARLLPQLPALLREFTITPGRRVYVMGPEQVLFVYNTLLDMDLYRVGAKLPHDSEYDFFQPDLIGRPKVRTHCVVPTLEALLGPWLIFRHRSPEREHLLFYYRGAGQREDEWTYMLDYLLHYQLLGENVCASIRLPNAAQEAPAMFERAKHAYIQKLALSPAFQSRYEAITCHPLRQTVPIFNEMQLGMDPHG
jgi:hypothetical protein